MALRSVVATSSLADRCAVGSEPAPLDATATTGMSVTLLPTSE